MSESRQGWYAWTPMRLVEGCAPDGTPLPKPLSATAIQVWIFVAAHARPRPGWKPSHHGIEVIAEKTKRNYRTVRKALDDLEAAGWLTTIREKVGGRPRYRFPDFRTPAESAGVGDAEPLQSVQGLGEEADQATPAESAGPPLQSVQGQPLQRVQGNESSYRDPSREEQQQRARDVFGSIVLKAKSRGLAFGRSSQKRLDRIDAMLEEGIDLEAEAEAWLDSLAALQKLGDSFGHPERPFNHFAKYAGEWPSKLRGYQAKLAGHSSKRGPVRAGRPEDFADAEPIEVQWARQTNGDLEAAWSEAIARDPTIERPKEAS